MEINELLGLLREWEKLERPFLPEREETIESLAYLIFEWTQHVLEKERTATRERILKVSPC